MFRTNSSDTCCDQEALFIYSLIICFFSALLTLAVAASWLAGECNHWIHSKNCICDWDDAKTLCSFRYPCSPKVFLTTGALISVATTACTVVTSALPAESNWGYWVVPHHFFHSIGFWVVTTLCCCWCAPFCIHGCGCECGSGTLPQGEVVGPFDRRGGEGAQRAGDVLEGACPRKGAVWARPVPPGTMGHPKQWAHRRHRGADDPVRQAP